VTAIYVDESIHAKPGYIVVAFALTSDDVQPEVDRQLRRLGYQPGKDEYKSSHRMDGDRKRRILRDAMAEILRKHFRLAFLVTAESERSRLGELTFEALASLARPRGIPPSGLQLYLDEGIDPPQILPDPLAGWARSGDLTISPDRDSRTVAGLQLADLAAHRCRVMLLGELGLNTKLVKAGAGSGYDPDTEFSIGSTMWGELRWLLMHGGHPTIQQVEAEGGHYVTVQGHGLFFSAGCPPAVSRAAIAAIGRCYLGCIH
jgi:hypothetical protein